MPSRYGTGLAPGVRAGSGSGLFQNSPAAVPREPEAKRRENGIAALHDYAVISEIPELHSGAGLRLNSAETAG